MNLILKKDDLNHQLNAWRQDYEVYAPQSLQNYTHFLPLQDGVELALDKAPNTRIPPNALFLPTFEALLNSQTFCVTNKFPQKPLPVSFLASVPSTRNAMTMLDTSILSRNATQIPTGKLAAMPRFWLALAAMNPARLVSAQQSALVPSTMPVWTRSSLTSARSSWWKP
jgi:hypothetical protein